MSRDAGRHAPVGRCAVVWLAIGVVVLLSWALAAPGLVTLAHTRGDGAEFDELLVQGCAAGLVVATGWLWLVATTTIGAALTGRAAHLPATAVRRGVLVLCGAALTAGMASPALAADATLGDVLGGLSLPDRTSAARVVVEAPAHERSGAPRPAVSAPAPSAHTESAHTESAHTESAHTVASPAPPAGAVSAPDVSRPTSVRVAAGDSLWTIAEAHARPGTSPTDRWQEIWLHNREVIGEDPDLILPGQQLELPHTHDGAPVLDETPEGPR